VVAAHKICSLAQSATKEPHPPCRWFTSLWLLYATHVLVFSKADSEESAMKHPSGTVYAPGEILSRTPVECLNLAITLGSQAVRTAAN
jgi:hypothetical protein